MLNLIKRIKNLFKKKKKLFKLKKYCDVKLSAAGIDFWQVKGKGKIEDYSRISNDEVSLVYLDQDKIRNELNKPYGGDLITLKFVSRESQEVVFQRAINEYDFKMLLKEAERRFSKEELFIEKL